MHVVALRSDDLSRLLEILDKGGSASDSIYLSGHPYEEEEIIYVTRRNILTLQSKLARHENGQLTAGCIVKNDTSHRIYPCTTRAMLCVCNGFPDCARNTTRLIPVEDEDYYIDRDPGPIDPRDDPGIGIKIPS